MRERERGGEGVERDGNGGGVGKCSRGWSEGRGRQDDGKCRTESGVVKAGRETKRGQMVGRRVGRA